MAMWLAIALAFILGILAAFLFIIFMFLRYFAITTDLKEQKLLVPASSPDPRLDRFPHGWIYAIPSQTQHYGFPDIPGSWPFVVADEMLAKYFAVWKTGVLYLYSDAASLNNCIQFLVLSEHRLFITSLPFIIHLASDTGNMSIVAATVDETRSVWESIQRDLTQLSDSVDYEPEEDLVLDEKNDLDVDADWTSTLVQRYFQDAYRRQMLHDALHSSLSTVLSTVSIPMLSKIKVRSLSLGTSSPRVIGHPRIRGLFPDGRTLVDFDITVESQDTSIELESEASASFVPGKWKSMKMAVLLRVVFRKIQGTVRLTIKDQSKSVWLFQFLPEPVIECDVQPVLGKRQFALGLVKDYIQERLKQWMCDGLELVNPPELEQVDQDLIEFGNQINDVNCQKCHISISGPRWRCLICPSFEYCRQCHAAIDQDHPHPFVIISHSTRVIRLEEKLDRRLQRNLTTHIAVTCSHCLVTPILGTRFCCAQCPDFDLCELCETLPGLMEKHGNGVHDLLKMDVPLNTLNRPVVVQDDALILECSRKSFNPLTSVSETVHYFSCSGSVCSIQSRYEKLRYQCLKCPQIRYCSACIVEVSRSHHAEHPFVLLSNSQMLIWPDKYGQDDAMHVGVRCDSDQCSGIIIGARYKCMVCEDFNFCESCERCEDIQRHHFDNRHVFLKIRYPYKSLARRTGFDVLFSAPLSPCD